MDLEETKRLMELEFRIRLRYTPKVHPPPGDLPSSESDMEVTSTVSTPIPSTSSIPTPSTSSVSTTTPSASSIPTPSTCSSSKISTAPGPPTPLMSVPIYPPNVLPHPLRRAPRGARSQARRLARQAAERALRQSQDK